MKNFIFLVILLIIFVSRAIAAIPYIPEIPLFPVIHATGNIYHVSKDTGSDHSNDGSLHKPWATLQYGINQLTAGDTLIVHQASTGYKESVNIPSAGTNDNWITIKGAEGENVVLKGGNIIFSNTAKFIHFNNIDIDVLDAGPRLLEMRDNSQYLAISDVEINCRSSDKNYVGVYANAGVRNIWFKDMDIHNCGYRKTNPTDCSGVCMMRRSVDTDPLLDKITFINVTVRDNKGDGIGSQHVDHVYFYRSIADNNTGDGFDIEAKTLAVFVKTVSSNNGPEDQGHGFKTWSKESWFVNCIAFNNHVSGIHNKPLHLESSIYVLNSTFAGNNNYRALGQISLVNLFARMEPDRSTTNIYLYNNIFHSINTPGVVFGDWSDQTLLGEDNNYYFSAQEEDMPRAYNWAIVLRESDANKLHRFAKGYTFAEVNNGVWHSDTGYGENDIGGSTKDVSGLVDPGFVKLYDDFHLKAGSKAIDAGVNIGLKEDLDGKPIPQGKAPDVGAYEF